MSDNADIPLYGQPLRDTWTEGERVERVTHDGPYGPERTRPGVVVAIDVELRRHEFLRVRFDDGEERQINPDVMRHVATVKLKFERKPSRAAAEKTEGRK